MIKYILVYKIRKNDTIQHCSIKYYASKKSMVKDINKLFKIYKDSFIIKGVFKIKNELKLVKYNTTKYKLTKDIYLVPKNKMSKINKPIK